IIALTRQKLPVFDQSRFASASNLVKGAYVLISSDNPEVLLLATGSEVHLAVGAYEKLNADGIRSRVVCMPSWELFEVQSEKYKESVLPRSITKRVAIEAGVKLGWERYIGSQGEFIGMSGFGASAPANVLFEKFGLTVERVVEKAKKLLLEQQM
ncbi:MAG TPA: transketolase C-terminal domain-containing protein, partial [Bacteroidota bacterium]|nr:transketolase C-terminal domain-containing protein [Bacteroidota bacterium]